MKWCDKFMNILLDVSFCEYRLTRANWFLGVKTFMGFNYNGGIGGHQCLLMTSQGWGSLWLMDVVKDQICKKRTDVENDIVGDKYPSCHTMGQTCIKVFVFCLFHCPPPFFSEKRLYNRPHFFWKINNLPPPFSIRKYLFSAPNCFWKKHHR